MRARANFTYLGAMVILLVAMAWVSLWAWGQTPYGRYIDHEQLGEVGLEGDVANLVLIATLFVAGWTLMTVAMMLPTTLPLLEMFRRLTLRRSDQTVLIALLILGYLTIWGGFGILAHVGDWGLHQAVEQIAWLESNEWSIGAGTLILAGFYQFTPLKYACLDKCRSPLSFVSEHWRGKHERRQALLLGVHHGIFCVGCCWSLMLLMFVVGVGNIGWMLVLGTVMAIEKNMPWGRRLSTPLGLALLGWGYLILVTSVL